MRLLNTVSFEFEEFHGQDIPKYAILSHTWGQQEVSYQDWLLRDQTVLEKDGYKKIRSFVALSRSKGFQYCWVDTCCIDKSSSAELSEAINSMYRWYYESEVCCAYLSDVLDKTQFLDSRWFTRGWTLQELLAPPQVEFYGRNWEMLGSREGMSSKITYLTGIDDRILVSRDFTDISVAKKMYWASARQTTRIEDMAYCLMGLFDVNMPLLYGEGEKAFIRLQQHIIETSNDQSIFAWKDPGGSKFSHRGLLAKSPGEFLACQHIESRKRSGLYGNEPYSITNRGLRIALPLIQCDAANPYEFWAALAVSTNEFSLIAIRLKKISADSDQFVRIETHNVCLMRRSEASKWKVCNIYIRQKTVGSDYTIVSRLNGFQINVWVRNFPVNPNIIQWPKWLSNCKIMGRKIFFNQDCFENSNEIHFAVIFRYATLSLLLQVKYMEIPAQISDCGRSSGELTGSWLVQTPCSWRLFEICGDYEVDSGTPPQNLILIEEPEELYKTSPCVRAENDRLILDIGFELWPWLRHSFTYGKHMTFEELLT